ncbi:MAG TPA: hypothetical protein DHU72_01655 [Rikenellaceae bacterium]|nr:hypothetical protein [Rikenellaceae bacterium]
MALISNSDKMLAAVLMCPELMKFGNYDMRDISSIYQAVNSDNYVVSAVARIIMRTSEGASENEIYKEITDFLKKNV